MSLDLDARQRAMLQEMGVAVWAPPPQAAVTAPAAAPAPTPTQAPATAEAHSPTQRPAQMQAPHAAPAPAERNAPAPRPAPAVSSAAPAAAPAAGAQALVLHAPLPVYPQADAAQTPAALGSGWLVVLEGTTPGEPLAGDAGKLLDNMLRAMRLHHHPRTQVAVLERAQPGQPTDGGDPAATLAQALAAERPAMVLLLGLGAARAVLGSREPLGRLRAGVHQIMAPDGTPVPAVVSYDPAYLLRAPDAKAAAWADLCRALAIVRGPAAT